MNGKALSRRQFLQLMGTAVAGTRWRVCDAGTARCWWRYTGGG